MDTEDTRRATIGDVAAHAGVSVTTVSHVLSGRRPVSTATQQKVRRSIDLLGFRPNEIARSMRSQRTHTAALVVPNIAHVVYPFVARGITEELRPLGYQISIYDTDDDPVVKADVLQVITDRRVDGVILFGFDITSTDAAVLTGASIPFVNGGLNAEVDGPYDCVRSDQRAGLEITTRHLIERFGGPLAFVGGLPGDGPADLRESGFRRAMAAAGLPVDERLVARVPYSWEGGREALAQLLAKDLPIRAVVCANDLIAIGGMAMARERGLRVPEDLAFTGYDNIEAGTMVVPTLTSVESFLDEQGRSCARLLIDRLGRGYGGPARHVSIDTALVVRASSGGTGS
ncbi:LacI family DNA-binding transcriptional regulator [Dactylosporangium siamense]|uniref:Ribose operon repressor n=1 Tax=Dactylosporangium siamense TaxID=685454 RepID=A0A919UAZ4_9ACTN|nr:LacI family DNA-binding transcriptional regulator [Dactylosporangium siamense]GIG45026.1 ribose operon repressor [Dactylosporangium siamense]